MWSPAKDTNTKKKRGRDMLVTTKRNLNCFWSGFWMWSQNEPGEFCIWLLPMPPLLPHILAIFADIGWFDVAADEPCAGRPPMTLTPFPWPGLEVPNASFSTGGCVCVVGCVCWCFNAFVRRFVTGTSRFRRGCSTGNTRRRFFGSFERAWHANDKMQTESEDKQKRKKKKTMKR